MIRRRGRLARELLPDPVTYYSERGFELKGRGAWRQTTCPFHADDHPSLYVNVESGGFNCFACGAKGDLLAFHMRAHGLNFREAAKDLGAWEPLP